MFAGCPLNLPSFSYGILLFFAFVAGMAVYSINCRRLAVKSAELVDLALVITIAPLIGARLFYILTFPRQFNGIRDYLALHEGGLVFYGALIAVLPALGIFASVKKIPFRQLLDLLVPSFALAHAIGRLGCLSNSCCYGAPTTAVQIYRLSSDPAGMFRHPTQLYEATFLLLIFFGLNKILTAVYRRQRFFWGFVSGFYLIAYSFCRFLIEFIRGDDRGGFLTSLHLSPSQIVALLLIISGIVWLNYCYKYPYTTGEQANEQS